MESLKIAGLTQAWLERVYGTALQPSSLLQNVANTLSAAGVAELWKWVKSKVKRKPPEMGDSIPLPFVRPLLVSSDSSRHTFLFTDELERELSLTAALSRAYAEHPVIP